MFQCISILHKFTKCRMQPRLGCVVEISAKDSYPRDFRLSNSASWCFSDGPHTSVRHSCFARQSQSSKTGHILGSGCRDAPADTINTPTPCARNRPARDGRCVFPPCKLQEVDDQKAQMLKRASLGAPIPMISRTLVLKGRGEMLMA